MRSLGIELGSLRLFRTLITSFGANQSLRFSFFKCSKSMDEEEEEGEVSVERGLCRVWKRICKREIMAAVSSSSPSSSSSLS